METAIGIIPSRPEAERIFQWAAAQNPEPWVNHCRIVARAAETIANKCGLDTDRAYISGLFHDIGYHAYKNGKGRSSHIYIGYEFLLEKGYGVIAQICLSHSFPHQNINEFFGSDLTQCSDKEIAHINKFLSETVFDDYDKLIQLCDCLGTAQSVCILEQRMINVVMRHGYNDFTFKKWDAIFAIKEYFDKKCGENIYNLFLNEITHNLFTTS